MSEHSNGETSRALKIKTSSDVAESVAEYVTLSKEEFERLTLRRMKLKYSKYSFDSSAFIKEVLDLKPFDEEVRRFERKAVRAKLTQNISRILLSAVTAPRVDTEDPTKKSVKVARPPGYGLIKFSELVFSKNFRSNVLEPTISDMQHEYNEALAAERPGYARWVRIRGYISYFAAIATSIPVGLGKLLVKLWKFS